MLLLGFVIGLSLQAIVVLWRCTYRVEEGHRAVLVTFGRAETGPKGELLMHEPGLHWKKPWQHAMTVSMKEQSLDLGDGEGAAAMASDGTILRLEAFVRYVPLEIELERFLCGMARPVEHITGLFTCLLRNEIANIRPRPPSAEHGLEVDALTARFDFAQQAGAYALVRQERRLLNARIQTFCEEKIADRYGVRFNAIDLADILPPDELAEALNAVMQSESEAEARLHRVEGECRQRIVSAERGVQIARSRSHAVELEIKKLASFLADLEDRAVLGDYVARRRAEVAAESRALFVKETEA